MDKNKSHLKNLIIDVAHLLSGRKANKVLVYDMSNITNLYDWSIIATSESGLHQRALISFVQSKLSELNVTHSISFRTEPKDSWVIIDIEFALIHVFSEEARLFYNLEGLWVSAEIIYQENENLTGDKIIEDSVR